MKAPANANQLADHLLSSGAISSPRVEAAFRAVPRHLFVPGVAMDSAYRDEAIPTKMLDGQAVSSASQPSIVAVMLEQLDVQRGQRVLEVGAGTGYNAALLAPLVGPEGRVVTIDIDQDIVNEAHAHLAAARVDGVEVVCGDGDLGHPIGAPYDRIVVTAGAWDIAPAWWQQLAPSGRLLLPLSLRGVQRCVALERRDGWLESVSVRACGFMRLRGAVGGPETVVAAGSVTVTFDFEVDASEVSATLSHHAGEQLVDSAISDAEVFGGLALWLALHEPGYCSLSVIWPTGDAPPVPVAAAFPSGQAMVGWSPASYHHTGLAVLGRGPNRLAVHAYGDSTDGADRLAAHIVQWGVAGRPDSQTVKLRVQPASEPIASTDGLITIEKRWTTITIDWPGT